jgi:hypothetical protein
METWFPPPGGDTGGCMTALRGEDPGGSLQDRRVRVRIPTAPGRRGQEEHSTRGRRASAGADAGLQNLSRTEEICLALLPYGSDPLRTRLPACGPEGRRFESCLGGEQLSNVVDWRHTGVHRSPEKLSHP